MADTVGAPPRPQTKAARELYDSFPVPDHLDALLAISAYEQAAAAYQAAVGTDAQFARLCEVIGEPALGTDARFADNPSRVANRAELRELLEARLRERPAAEWIEAFTAANIPAGRVNTIAQAFELAESLGLGTVVMTPAIDDTGAAQQLRSVATPISFSQTPAEYTTPPPRLGEHDGADWLPRA